MIDLRRVDNGQGGAQYQVNARVSALVDTLSAVEISPVGERWSVVRGQKWTVQEWAAMTAAEQDAVFQASVVTDLSQVPTDYLAEVRQEFEARIAQLEMPSAS